MSNPLVTVICICFNQRRFLNEAVESVLGQTYPYIELIIIDDKSDDGSQAMIRDIGKKNDGIKVLLNDRNIGNCRSFNQAYSLSEGEYLIDLAADDILLPERVEAGLSSFRHHPEEYGVHFTDVEYIDEHSKFIRYHFSRDYRGRLKDHIPEGWVYQELLSRYFICPASMMMKRKVLEYMGGYDETLSYEDFDLWVRSSRAFKYCFTDQVLVKKRLHKNSYSRRQYKYGSPQLRSTLEVCRKAVNLNRTKAEEKALNRRILYEMRQAVISGNLGIARNFFQLLLR